eukprot:Hpha_TRINITY_DN15712_c3_g2::TRINITY_DN15712_c3_g2_i3::g.38429::m.38429
MYSGIEGEGEGRAKLERVIPRPWMAPPVPPPSPATLEGQQRTNESRGGIRRPSGKAKTKAFLHEGWTLGCRRRAVSPTWIDETGTAAKQGRARDGMEEGRRGGRREVISHPPTHPAISPPPPPRDHRPCFLADGHRKRDT